MLDFLEDEKIDKNILSDLKDFREEFGIPDDGRVPVPRFYYYGRDVWEKALTALLTGKNLLLTGSKATGKTVLAENLAAAFGRPAYNISFHVNMDAASLIGADTFRDGEVVYREGPVTRCVKTGGFAVMDEINMAKNEALAVLHSILDYRRLIDIPGYDLIHVHPAARFIATMNYGYAGTRDLNEALESRFVVVRMPFIKKENLVKLLMHAYPRLRRKYAEMFADLFYDIKNKADSSEISEKPLDLRGLLDSIDMCQYGLELNKALDMGITDKSDDGYERELIADVIRSRLPKKTATEDIFE
ncbi:MAG: AAA family ATPase [Anaerovoracaceae bacterium]